ncbi:MAG: ribonuclease E inhibitor RraB [Planctomycetota bacterium]
MSIVDLLLETARADTELLITNDQKGDLFATPRIADFILIADTEQTADTVASFIVDNRYCRIDPTEDEKFHIVAQLEMPITQNVACAVSGLFACISKIFGVDYDGWSCTLRPETPKNQ